MNYAIIAFTVIMGAAGDLLNSRGMSTGGELHDFGPSGIAKAIRFILTRKLVILGICCDAAAFFALLGLLRVEQLSVAVPATALGFVLDTIGAKFLLGERVHWKRWVGVLCVAGGVTLCIE